MRTEHAFGIGFALKAGLLSSMLISASDSDFFIIFALSLFQNEKGASRCFVISMHSYLTRALLSSFALVIWWNLGSRTTEGIGLHLKVCLNSCSSSYFFSSTMLSIFRSLIDFGRTLSRISKPNGLGTVIPYLPFLSPKFELK